MTDQQRLLVALLSDAASTEADVEHLRRLQRLAVLDLVAPTPASRYSLHPPPGAQQVGRRPPAAGTASTTSSSYLTTTSSCAEGLPRSTTVRRPKPPQLA